MMKHSNGISSLSPEIIEHALTHCHPRDVAAFSQTCRTAYQLVYHSRDQYLWRQLFLSYPFDDPRRSLQGLHRHAPFDWKSELQRRVLAEAIARSPSATPEELMDALETFLNVRVPSQSLLWVVDVLQSSNMLHLPLFDHCNTSQNLAQLRSYLALTLDDYDEDDVGGMEWMKVLRAKSRCYVYDLRNYCRENDWGPFWKNGCVNWVHVESIMNVLSSNLAELSEPSQIDIRPPCGLEATRAYSAPGATTRNLKDWAGVEGTWGRYISFMDHRNFRLDGGAFFERARYGEVTCLLDLTLHLVEPDAIPDYYTLESFPESDDPRYPTLYFSGTSVGIQGNENEVIGSAYMNGVGVVRWRFASVYDNHLLWSSEGVQVGGIASAAGVVGSWTSVYHEHGPFWLWKISNPA
ncbi:hypothetical protein EDC04DRAFT_2638904 [Pisolithus marmoratus]|nr:hypothetical protein EDC04DRAFT_2638904 [Pisolithus marmoratus]